MLTLKVVDSTFLISLLRNDPATVRKAEELDEEGGAATTVINVFEVVHGVYRSMSDVHRRMEAFDRLIANFEVLRLDIEAAKRAAQISGTLVREGIEIGPFDSLIAGITLVYGAESLVTRNTSHFNRVPGLTVEEH